jgi:hypothetical protein
MKLLSRVIVLNLIISFIVGFFISPFSVSMEATNTVGDWALLLYGAFTVLGIFFWLFYMFWHWGMSSFISRTHKKLWFVVLLVGIPIYLLGPIVYYICVYEMRKGLQGKPGS